MKPFLVLFFIAASAFATPDEKKPTKDRVTRELVRDPASDFDSECSLVTEADGHEYLQCFTPLPAGVVSMKAHVEPSVNPANGTFLMKRGEIPADLAAWEHIQPEPEDDGEGEVKHRHGDATTQEKAATPGELPEPHGDNCPCEGMECIGSINTWIYSRDNPMQSNLTKTSVIGGWQRKVTNLSCRWVGLPNLHGCVGASPSTMGTHWSQTLLSGCTKIGPIINSGPGGMPPGHWEMGARGSFSNYDFGTPYPVGTYSTTTIKFTFHNGVPGIMTNHDGGWGEGYERLYYPFDLSYFNECAQ